MFSTRTALFGASAAAPAPPPPPSGNGITLIYSITSANTEVSVPLGSVDNVGGSSTTDAIIYWGDDSTSTANGVGHYNHTYANTGNYTVAVEGTVTRFGSNFNSNAVKLARLISVDAWGNTGLTSLVGAFVGFAPSDDANNLISVAPPPNSVTDMAYTLFNCVNFNGNVANWNVGNVANMNSMFNTASNFNQDISSWDTSSVTDMGAMFQYTNLFNQDISGWDVGNVTDMNNMFEESFDFNQNLSSWVTGLTSQPTDFSLSANATFANNASNLKPYLQDGVTRINT